MTRCTTPHLTPPRNLGFLFVEHLTFSDQISAISKACYYHIRQLRCIRPYLDSTTACSIATSIVHSKLDYCNSLYYDLPSLRLPASNKFRTLFSCPCCCYHFYLTLSSRVQNNLKHRMQTSLTHLQSPHNHPTSSSQLVAMTLSLWMSGHISGILLLQCAMTTLILLASEMFYVVRSIMYSAFLVNVTQLLNCHSLDCLLYTSPSPRDRQKSRMPSSA